MNKILSTEAVPELSKFLHEQNKVIVLAGGCFDILHIGHVTFLKAAKEEGDIVIVLLESDAAITQSKGKGRPVNQQRDRARILAALEMVDYVITLPTEMKNEDYDALVIQIKPAIIATTAGDTHRIHKERQAKKIKGSVVDVTPALQNHSTTKLFKILGEL